MFYRALILLTLLFSVSPAQSDRLRFNGFESGQQGMGLLAGLPTGVRYIYWLSYKRAIFADLVFDFDGIAMAQGSYAFYFYDAKDQWKKKRGFNTFLFYIAPGAIAGVRVSGADTASAAIFGARGVGGLEYIFGAGYWSVRAEIGANINLIGRTFAGLQALAGLTYYFDHQPYSE